MRVVIIPVGSVYRLLRKGAVRVLGDEEVRSLEDDAVGFIDEVYDDTIGDMKKRLRAKEEQAGKEHLIRRH